MRLAQKGATDVHTPSVASERESERRERQRESPSPTNTSQMLD